MKQIILILLGLLYTFQINAQESQKKYEIKGFVKTDMFYDSRQTISARDGHFLIMPAAPQFDALGNDINLNDNFNILSVQTRLNSTFWGPKVLNGASSAFIEGEFFGHSNADINGFRLRHAFIKLSWKNDKILFGQTWHPMFVTDVFPGTVSFNTGVPFQPFSRNPQLRFTHSFNKLNVITALYSQRDFSSLGPAGQSSIYLRNSGIPGLHLQLQLKSDALVTGVGADFKRIKPRIETSSGYTAESTVDGFAAIGYLKYKKDEFSSKLYGSYGSNLSDMIMIGGYAINNIDPVTQSENYTAIKTFSTWLDLNYGKSLQTGLFLGYTNNLGSNEKITGTIYSLVPNVNFIYRISPRITWKKNNLQLGSEFEYTAASYGSVNEFAKVTDSKTVGNLRLLLAAFYFFEI